MLLRRASALTPTAKSADRNFFFPECVSLVYQKRCFFASDLSAIALAAKQQKGVNRTASSRDHRIGSRGSDDDVSMGESRLYKYTSNSSNKREGRKVSEERRYKSIEGSNKLTGSTEAFYDGQNSLRTREPMRSGKEGNLYPSHFPARESQVARSSGRRSFPAVVTIEGEGAERSEIEKENDAMSAMASLTEDSGIDTSTDISISRSALFVSESSFTTARDVGRYGDVTGTPFERSGSSSSERASQHPKSGSGAFGGELSATSSTGGASGAEAIAQMRSHQKQIREMFSDQPIIAINGAPKKDGASTGRGAVHEIPLLPVRYLKYTSHGRRGPLHSRANDAKSTSAKRLTSELGLPISSIATPYASRAEERLHQVRQHNLLAQIGMTKRELEGKVTPTHQAAEIAKAIQDSPGYAVKSREARDSQNRLPFRCLSCFHVFEALPSKLLKHVSLDGSAGGGKGGGGDGGTGGGLSSAASLESETKKHLARRVNFRSVSQLAKWKTANTIEARRLEEERNPTKCPNCGSRRVQWLMEYCHRSLHTSKLR